MANAKHSDVRDLVLNEMQGWGTFKRNHITKVIEDLDLGWNEHKVKNQTSMYLKHAISQGLVKNVGRNLYEFIGSGLPVEGNKEEKQQEKVKLTSFEREINSNNKENVNIEESKEEVEETVLEEKQQISSKEEDTHLLSSKPSKERVSRKGRSTSKEDKDAEFLKLLDETLDTVRAGVIKNSNEGDNPQIRLALGLVQEIFEVVGHKPLNVLEMSNDDFTFYKELNKSLIRLEDILYNFNDSKKRGRAFVL